ncbi:olfactory receptor 5J3-like [Lissotriton helveticus]
MGLGNQSMVEDFILLGMSNKLELQPVLFIVFLLVYIITLFGNVGMILLVWVSDSLQTPMYFFIAQLSFVDLWYSCTVNPRMLADFLSLQRTISILGCFVQLFFFGSFATTECFIIAVMAYDRYLAVCNPLLYSLLMNSTLTGKLLFSAYCGGFLHGLIHTCGVVRLRYCGPNLIPHFVCDLPQLLRLSCSDTSLNVVFIFVFGGIAAMGSLIIVVVSYTFILMAVLKIRSREGRQRAFSTCTSHFTCVSLSYGTIFTMYFRPKSIYLPGLDAIASVCYAILVPMVNPLIYSLRNSEVKGALRKVIQRISIL